MRILTVLPTIFFLIGCASDPQLIFDPATVESAAQFELDQQECTEIASTYDLTGETVIKSVAGGAIGATAVAGIATAVAGAVFLPAIPFIIAGGVVGGGLWGNSVSQEEAEARDQILSQCMEDRGYRIYNVDRD